MNLAPASRFYPIEVPRPYADSPVTIARNVGTISGDAWDWPTSPDREKCRQHFWRRAALARQSPSREMSRPFLAIPTRMSAAIARNADTILCDRDSHWSVAIARNVGTISGDARDSPASHDREKCRRHFSRS